MAEEIDYESAKLLEKYSKTQQGINQLLIDMGRKQEYIILNTQKALANAQEEVEAYEKQIDSLSHLNAQQKKNMVEVVREQVTRKKILDIQKDYIKGLQQSEKLLLRIKGILMEFDKSFDVTKSLVKSFSSPDLKNALEKTFQSAGKSASKFLSKGSDWAFQKAASSGTGSEIFSKLSSVLKGVGASVALAAGLFVGLVETFMEMVNGARLMKSEFTKASAAGGHFGDVIGDITNRDQYDKLAEDIYRNSYTIFTELGLSVKQFGDVVTSVISTGAFKDFGSEFKNVKDPIEHLLAFAATTGQDAGSAVQQIASFRRNFRGFSTDFSKNTTMMAKISNDASAVASTGIETTTEFTQTLESLGKQMSMLNIDGGKTSGILKNLTIGLNGLGLGAEAVKNIFWCYAGWTKCRPFRSSI